MDTFEKIIEFYNGNVSLTAIYLIIINTDNYINNLWIVLMILNPSKGFLFLA
jgi:hypothetical protein